MSDFEDKVLQEIERRHLKPRSAFYFLGKRSVFWTLAGLSIVFGSIAAATSLFLLLDNLYNGGRELDEIPFDNVAAFAPLAWVALFVLFGLSAQRSFKVTRDGYRYRPSRVIGAAIAISAAFGLLLYTVDAGGVAHRYLASHVRSYAQFTTIPYDHWSRPAEGFLGGEVIKESATEIVIRDFHGKVWIVDTSTANSMLDRPALEEGDIAIRGSATGDATFKAMTIVPFD
jgi:tryptophan-rich sensory protein